MLKKYSEYIKRRCIPYYWNKNFNLIEELNEETSFCIANKIRNIIDEIERICSPNSVTSNCINNIFLNFFCKYLYLNKECFDYFYLCIF